MNCTVVEIARQYAEIGAPLSSGSASERIALGHYMGRLASTLEKFTRQLLVFNRAMYYAARGFEQAGRAPAGSRACGKLAGAAQPRDRVIRLRMLSDFSR